MHAVRIGDDLEVVVTDERPAKERRSVVNHNMRSLPSCQGSFMTAQKEDLARLDLSRRCGSVGVEHGLRFYFRHFTFYSLYREIRLG